MMQHASAVSLIRGFGFTDKKKDDGNDNENDDLDQIFEREQEEFNAKQLIPHNKDYENAIKQSQGRIKKDHGARK